MTGLAIENRDAFREPPPTDDTLGRLDDLFQRRRNLSSLIATRRRQIRIFDDCNPEAEAQASDRRRTLVNQLTQADMRLAEVEIEIYNVARLLVAETDNAEFLNEN